MLERTLQLSLIICGSLNSAAFDPKSFTLLILVRSEGMSDLKSNVSVTSSTVDNWDGFV